MVDPAYYRDLLRPIFSGRRIVIFGLVLAGATELIRQLRALGAPPCLVVAAGLGTGELPSPEDADWLILDVRSDDIVDEFHAWERIAANPPRALVHAIDRFDPAGDALILAPPVTLGPLPERLAGRQFWGRRRGASLALEDKTQIDAFWDAAGIERAPSVLASVNVDAATGASRRMDRGAGTVWAGDARDGLHGGAHLVRRVNSQDDLTAALDFFGHRCDRVRIMPFLEGIPCSIHGIVFPDHVAALRPVEMVTLRPVGSPQFLYAGAATYWDPPGIDREDMRSLVRRAGEAYRKIAGLGTFTIDGVMTEDGFRPTEMNARYGAGLNVVARQLADLPLSLLMQALLEGALLDYRPRELEVLLLDGADRHRGGGGWTVFHRREEASHEHALVATNGGYRLASPGEVASASLMIGPSNVGGFLRFTPMADQTRVGPSIAPQVVAAFSFTDKQFATGFGPLAAAIDVRKGGERGRRAGER